MNPEIISYRGWSNTLRLANNDFELLVTTDVGRVFSFTKHHSAKTS